MAKQEYEEIIIDISPEGEVTIEANNVVGPSCHALTKDIEEGLGATTNRQNKPEFKQVATQKQVQKRDQNA